MNTKVENPEKNIVLLEMEVDENIFEEAMEKSFIKNKGKFTVPGFRKGKAPRVLVQRFYGESFLHEDAVNLILPSVYEDALKQEDLSPMSEPEFDVKQIGDGKPLILTARFAVKPEISIEGYVGIEIPEIENNVTEEDIDKKIEEQREKSARIFNVEDRPIQERDIAVIDYEGFVDDVAFEGGKAENQSITIGDKQFIPGFEEQLIGKNVGDECEIEVTFPEDYNAKELAGKKAVFKIKIHEIKNKELPEPDDEFAKDVSEFDTISEYRESIRKELEQINENNRKRAIERKVFDKISELAVTDIPKEIIDGRVKDKIEEMKMSLSYQGYDINQYFAMMGMNEGKYKEAIKPSVIKELKTHLAIEAISEKEDISASDEEIEARKKEVSNNYNQNSETEKEELSEREIKSLISELKYEKTVKFLIENVVMVKDSSEEV
jgi:trigger factor